MVFRFTNFAIDCLAKKLLAVTTIAAFFRDFVNSMERDQKLFHYFYDENLLGPADFVAINTNLE